MRESFFFFQKVSSISWTCSLEFRLSSVKNAFIFYDKKQKFQCIVSTNIIPESAYKGKATFRCFLTRLQDVGAIRCQQWS